MVWLTVVCRPSVSSQLLHGAWRRPYRSNDVNELEPRYTLKNFNYLSDGPSSLWTWRVVLSFLCKWRSFHEPVLPFVPGGVIPVVWSHVREGITGACECHICRLQARRRQSQIFPGQVSHMMSDLTRESNNQSGKPIKSNLISGGTQKRPIRVARATIVAAMPAPALTRYIEL
jgi:hypothetical protein